MSYICPNCGEKEDFYREGTQHITRWNTAPARERINGQDGYETETDVDWDEEYNDDYEFNDFDYDGDGVNVLNVNMKHKK